jgi:hypothetical protein
MSLKIGLFFLGFMLSTTPIDKNKVDSLDVSLNNINVIVLDLAGNIHIKKNDTDKLSVHLELKTGGFYFGFGGDKERPRFKTIYEIKNDTLFVKTPKFWNRKVIGVNLYNEMIEGSVSIPDNKIIIISEANDIVFDNKVENLKVDNTDLFVLKNMSKSNFRFLLCRAKDEVKINGTDKGSYLEIVGSGQGIYKINARNIYIN